MRIFCQFYALTQVSSEQSDPEGKTAQQGDFISTVFNKDVSLDLI